MVRLRVWDITNMFNIQGEQYATLAEEIYVDSCGRKGLGETPQCLARGGSPAARGKRSIIP
ncbi:hypothetical protein E3U55_09840 [Filobacillus milosensis]|uniref:Uncharacterized protein n=1 Tax=Filobacillus milosensis TaxID=94137 RepID=A0A4Y8IMJ3_9BACI|nr:hypothetical protein E3U55_09840 [Filobacillus milosensis]